MTHQFASNEWLWSRLDSAGRLQAQAEYALLQAWHFDADPDGAAWKDFEMVRIEHFVEGYQSEPGRTFHPALVEQVSADQRQRLATWRVMRAQIYLPERRKGLPIFKDDGKGEQDE